MKSLLTAVVLLITLSGCKKFIEQQKENYVLSTITDGQWIITKFINAGDTITNDFSPYSFQFNRDYTVDAINQNAIEKGVWEGNPNTMNIMASFPNATSPISMINGTWHIDQNSLTYVIASQNGTNGQKNLRLDKK
ncbi:MAG TPA: hypothetical protein VHN59_19775 [Chitinophagaceae bacterium]|nr:hypothetical protein [Chitinophagaceae bacterium]